MAVLRRKVADPADVGGPPSDPRSVLKSFPAVIEHCTARKYEDGSAREPGMLFISVRGGEWRVTAKDPDADASISVQDPSLTDALAALDLLLANPDAQWQIDRWGASRGRGKGKGK